MSIHDVGSIFKFTKYAWPKELYTRDELVTAITYILDSQFHLSTADRAVFHEFLVHPAVAMLHKKLGSVLIIGGGDGIAVREVLRYPEVRRIVVNDLQEPVSYIYRNWSLGREMNGDSLRDARVELVHRPFQEWIPETDEKFDLVVFDLPAAWIFRHSAWIEMFMGIMDRDSVASIQCAFPDEDGPRYLFEITKAWTSRGFGAAIFDAKLFSLRSSGEAPFVVLSQNEMDVPESPTEWLPGLEVFGRTSFRKFLRTVLPPG